MKSVSTYINTLNSKEAVLDLTQQVLHSGYPLAVWRLPNASEIFILIDLSRNSTPIELEEIRESFIVNSFEECHPPRPLIIRGDIVIKLEGERVDVKFGATLSAELTDAFFAELETKKPEANQELTAPVGTTAYEELVRRAIARIRDGGIQKIVLSRCEDFDLPEDFNPLMLFEELTRLYPNAFCYLTHTNEFGLWVGASPEKLISIEKDRYFSTDSLAGTQLLNDQELSEVAWKQKEIEEQAMVSRYIINCLKKIRLREFDEIGPRTIQAGALAHLKTEFRVDMEATNSPMLGSTMLNLLHPTSAVCGLPGRAAHAFINEHEGYERELYAGFLGPVGFDGETRLFVNLRCMKIVGKQARLYAGAGIMEDSDPARELEETNYKMQTLLKVLYR